LVDLQVTSIVIVSIAFCLVHFLSVTIFQDGMIHDAEYDLTKSMRKPTALKMVCVYRYGPS